MIFLPFILLRVQEFIKQQKVVLTVVGDLGQPGLHVRRPVGEEIRRERDCVTAAKGGRQASEPDRVVSQCEATNEAGVLGSQVRCDK